MRRSAAETLLAEIGIPQWSRSGTFEAVLAQLPALSNGRVLDAPCGPGRLSEALRRQGISVTAGDLDPSGFVPRDRVACCALDLDRPLPFADASFDAAVCGDGIEHLENPFALFRELARVLRDGGTLVVATPNYSRVEVRLRFLLSGSLEKPRERTGVAVGPGKTDRGHINPLTLTHMAEMANEAGLVLERAETAAPAHRQLVLAPLALAIVLYRACLSARYRRGLWAEHTLSLGMLLGGKKLIAVFGKRGARAWALAAPDRRGFR